MKYSSRDRRENDALARPTYAEIDLDAIAHNIRLIKGRTGPRCAAMPAVKADAYGHGAVAVAAALECAGADGLSVATVEEGVELREAGVTLPILLLGYVPEEDFDLLVHYGLIASIIEPHQAVKLNETARRHGVKLKVHVNVDTGMRRLGLDWNRAAAAIQCITQLVHLDVAGVWTHFARGEEVDLMFCREQVARLTTVRRELTEAHAGPFMFHACNSAALLRFPEAHFDGVRPGIVLYGLKPDCCRDAAAEFRPVMSIKTCVVSVKSVTAGEGIGYGHSHTVKRNSLIATLPIGYYDGFIRQYSNNGHVLVRGRCAPVVGRVCMDQCMIDVTDVPGIRTGEEVVVYGNQGEHVISIEECAQRMDTIPHTITCAISRRVPRKYFLNGAEVSVDDLRRRIAAPVQQHG